MGLPVTGPWCGFVVIDDPHSEARTLEARLHLTNAYEWYTLGLVSVFNRVVYHNCYDSMG